MVAITQQELKRLLWYHAESGVFRWRFARAAHIKPWDMAGSKDNHGYIKIMIRQRLFKAHRLAWLYAYGEMPSEQIDHINGVRTDNRIENLRLVSNKHNQENVGPRSNNSTGFRGVSFNQKSRRYEAYITNNRKKISLGMFESPEIAASVAAEKRAEMFTHAARAAIAKHGGK